MKPLQVGLLGFGTVGRGTWDVLRRNEEEITRRAGRPIRITWVATRTLDRAREGMRGIEGVNLTNDPHVVTRHPDLDIVCELVGGVDAARGYVLDAIAHGKHVVTANKALLAHHGNEIFAAAHAKGVMVAFEAAVAGGVPIIKALREGLTANRIEWIAGIINGTSNFILSTMRETGASFEAVLKEAQARGYAEADPSFDIDGIDAAHKLAVLAAVAFGSRVNFAGVYVEGIRRVGALDINFARELGYRIKLLGHARMTEHGLEQRVHPCMVPLAAPIASVDGVFNAVAIEGDFVGSGMFVGRGAGAGPTASAVVADLVDVARGRILPAFVVPASKLADPPAAPMQRHRGAYYVRLMVNDRPGVIADVTAALRDERVSLKSMLQHGRAPGPDDSVPVVLETHETEEAAMLRAIARISALSTVLEPPCLIRVERG